MFCWSLSTRRFRFTRSMLTGVTAIVGRESKDKFGEDGSEMVVMSIRCISRHVVDSTRLAVITCKSPDLQSWKS